MTFGTARWGLDEAGSVAVFNAYVEAGGNFNDTADVYAAGCREEILGKFVAEQKLREQIVIATSRLRRRQRRSNASALDIVLSPEHQEALHKVSASADLRMLYSLFTPALRQYAVFGSFSVNAQGISAQVLSRWSD